MTLYDHLSVQTLATVERLLLHSLSHEPSEVVRRKAVDTICDISNNSMTRGRPWHALQAQAFAMTQSADSIARESAFRVFAGCPNLIVDLQTESVLSLLQKGLQDPQSVEVRPRSVITGAVSLRRTGVYSVPFTMHIYLALLPLFPDLYHAFIFFTNSGSTRCFASVCVLSVLVRLASNCTIPLTYVPHARHLTSTSALAASEIPQHPHASYNLISSTLCLTSTRASSFPPCPHTALCRSRPHAYRRTSIPEPSVGIHLSAGRWKREGEGT